MMQLIKSFMVCLLPTRPSFPQLESNWDWHCQYYLANSNEKKLWMNGLTKDITILQLSIQEIKVMVMLNQC
jgi:hypothetical protein